jgi:hypothetical protein
MVNDWRLLSYRVRWSSARSREVSAIEKLKWPKVFEGKIEMFEMARILGVLAA